MITRLIVNDRQEIIVPLLKIIDSVNSSPQINMMIIFKRIIKRAKVARLLVTNSSKLNFGFNRL